MGIIMDIPYAGKEEFKNSGGFWDKEMKTWYIPNYAKIRNFEKWLPDGALIVKNPFYISISSRGCWKCGEQIPLIALGADSYILQDEDEDSEMENQWYVENGFTLFQNIEYLPTKIIGLIQSEYPFFKQMYSKQLGAKYWANSCPHCGALQGDWFNHEEPEGAFCPCSPDEAKRITLVKKGFPYDFPVVAGYGYGDSLDFIDTYAERK